MFHLLLILSLFVIFGSIYGIYVGEFTRDEFIIIIMSNLANLEIAALDNSGKNYMRWAIAARLHLKGKGLLDTIDKSKTTSEEQKAKAMIFLFHHIHDILKDEYMTKEDPADLWQSLKDRFDHQKYVILPKAKYEWLNLRFQDYKSVAEYNSALFGIVSRITLCGEEVTDYDMIEKTLQTFHPGNVLLQQQYRATGYTKYSELMQVLLVAEQNNELVLLNHQSRPTGSAPFPEANVTSNYNNYGRGRGRGNNRGRGRGGYGRGRGGYGRGRGRGRGQERDFRPNEYNSGRENKKFKGNEVGRENACYRCGMKGHWSRTCRTPKHLADLYQKSQKEKQRETNFIHGEAGPSFDGITDDTHLDVADFFADPEDINEKQDE